MSKSVITTPSGRLTLRRITAVFTATSLPKALRSMHPEERSMQIPTLTNFRELCGQICEFHLYTQVTRAVMRALNFACKTRIPPSAIKAAFEVSQLQIPQSAQKLQP